MSVWTTPDPARYAPAEVLAAEDLNNIEGNFERMADRFRSATASADLTLTGSYQDVTDAEVELTHDGVWFVTAFVVYVGAALDAGNTLQTRLVVDGVAQTGTATVRAFDNDFLNASSGWPVTVAGGPVTAKLQSLKGGGTGASFVRQTVTKLFAFWMSA